MASPVATGTGRDGLIAALREGGWIGGARLRVYAIGIICAYAALLVIAVLRGFWLYQPDGTPVPGDFIAFWSAVRMAIAGQAGLAYDWAAHHAVQVAGIGQEFDGFFAWHNPPHLLLVLLPFGLLPYVTAWIAFDVVTATAFVLVFRRVLPWPGAGWIALAAPASFLCIIAGQLGFVVAALSALFLLLLDRRPVAAGLCLALLTVKPQFGVVYPLLLLAGGHWRTFIAASVGVVALVVVSAGILGTDAWTAFLASLSGETADLLRRGGSDWGKLQSLYASVFRLTRNEGLSMAVHGVSALAVAAVAMRIWWKPAASGPRNAAAVAAAFLMTPYAYVYDAPLVVVAAGFLAQDALVRGFLPWERLLLCVAVIMPVTFFIIGSIATPLAMLMLLALALRRNTALPR